MFEPKGIVADKTFVILNGATAISEVEYYTEIYKDSNGKKKRKMHSCLYVEFGEYSKIRFERLREGVRQHMSSNDAHTYVLYTKDSLHKLREDIISLFKKG